MDTKKLWKRLSDTSIIAFSTGGEATELPAVPGLTIEGIGEVALPLSDNEVLKRVLAQCRQAPFGRGMETLVDTTVRKTWQLEPSRFSFAHPDWNAGLQQLLLRVGNGMGCADGIACHIYKLLIYEAGGHFVFHRDTEKEPGMFATLVVQLPSRFTGGSLIVKHQTKSLKYDFGCGSGRAPFMAHFAAHFADVEHKVEEVQSGIRVAVVYNICWVESGPAPSVSAPHTSAFNVASILAQWDLAVHSKLFFCLEHYYTKQSIVTGLAALKGNDREKVNVLIDANNMLDEGKKLNIYLAIAERMIVYSGDDEYRYRCYYRRGHEQYWELSEDTVSITPWFDTTGSKFEAGEFVDIDIEKESLNDVWVDDSTVEEDVKPYTGNEGATKTTVYHRCIVAFWPAAHEIALVLPHGGVCVGVNILKSMASKCSDTTVPEQRAAVEVKKFQSFFLDTLLPVLLHDAEKQVASSLPSIGSSICQVSDIISAQRLLSQCIAKIGLCSDSVSSTIVCIGDKFGWAEIASFVLPLLSDLKDYEFSRGVEVFVKMVEGNPMLLQDHTLKQLGSQLISVLSHYLSPLHTPVLPSVAKVCLMLNDCSLARKFLSHISRIGICSNDTSNAVVALFHQFGIEAFIDLIPGAFSVLSGSEEGTCSLLATLLLEHHGTYLELLIPIAQQVLKHVVKAARGKQYVDHLISITAELKDNLSLCRRLIADVLLPVGLGPDNSIVSDAVILISCNIGWTATRDVVPAFFQNLTSFCPEAYQTLLAFALKEDNQVGITCCAILAQKALLATSSSSLPAKDAASLIVQVFIPLGNRDASTKFVSNVLQHTDSKALPILIAGLHANLSPQLLQAPPLLSIIVKRKTDITATLAATPFPSWSVPNESTMPQHYQKVVDFLKSDKFQTYISGFSNIADARKFVKRYQGKLPVTMKEGGVGSRAHVMMSQMPELRTDMLHHETRSQLQAELKELCALLPAQYPAQVGSSETAALSPSSKSKANLCRKPLVSLVETVPSRETPSTSNAKRIKKEPQ